MRKTLHFKTNTLLKNLVGKDLINDDNIAIVELVKNSLDAESDGVLVRFTDFSPEGVTTESSQIIIADEGIGMDIIDIEDKWLNIAYSEKIFLEQERGAYLAGNKGIGRFSCDRLGKQLDLLTRRNGSELFHMRIRWHDFEKEGEKDLTIQEIPLDAVSISDGQAAQLAGIPEFPETGTVLVISSLRSTWNRAKLRELKTSLEKFLNPNQLFSRDQFKINLSVPTFEKTDAGKSYPDRITGEIQNQIFEKLKFKTTYIEAKISDDAETLSVVLYHEGDKVFDLVERNDSYPLLRGVYTIIYYLNPYKKAYFKRQTGVRSVEFGSIFLFLNGFRVAPYGDRSDDWLGLDVRKTQGTARYLSSRDVVGRIEITSNDERFAPISSREGLIKTDAFDQLRKDLFIDMLRKLERFVVEGLGWDSVPESIRQDLNKSEGLDWDKTPERYTESWERKKQRIVLSIMTLIGSSPDRIIKFWFNPALLEEIYESRQEEVKSLIANIEGYEPGKVDADLTKSLSKFRKLIDEKEEEARVAKVEAADLRLEVVEKEEQISKLEDGTETYRAQTLFLKQVMPLDVPQLMSYHHQINLDSIIVDNYLAKAIKALRNIPKSQGILDNLQKASLANKRIAAVAQFATKADFRSGTKKEITDIPAFFEQYLLKVAKDFIAANLKLDVSNNVQEAFKMKASRIELSILIDNIISNASKALARRLAVRISKISENTLRISFIDDGKGLSKELPEIDSMFEMGITTTAGSGLGLYQAKEIAEKMGGQISAMPIQPNGMEIRVEVTR
ncbi:MAG: ATP-binding protein [Chloroflexi bacterium]|nr:ATP-binding protein [Chloroflexota bacterium]